jgi:hypothetical protein
MHAAAGMKIAMMTREEKPMISMVRLVLLVAASGAMLAQAPELKDAPSRVVTGYVRDSGCVHRFHEVVQPLPNGCVEACVRGGSPIVILTKDEQVYHPISGEMPDIDVRPKLLPFVGKLVRVTGHVYERGGSTAISLERIEAVTEAADNKGSER